MYYIVNTLNIYGKLLYEIIIIFSLSKPYLKIFFVLSHELLPTMFHFLSARIHYIHTDILE